MTISRLKNSIQVFQLILHSGVTGITIIIEFARVTTIDTQWHWNNNRKLLWLWQSSKLFFLFSLLCAFWIGQIKQPRMFQMLILWTASLSNLSHFGLANFVKVNSVQPSLIIIYNENQVELNQFWIEQSFTKCQSSKICTSAICKILSSRMQIICFAKIFANVNGKFNFLTAKNMLTWAIFKKTDDKTSNDTILHCSFESLGWPIVQKEKLLKWFVNVSNWNAS